MIATIRSIESDPIGPIVDLLDIRPLPKGGARNRKQGETEQL